MLECSIGTIPEGGPMAEQIGDPQSEFDAARRPQTLMLSFLGIHVRGRAVAIYSGGLIDVLGRVGVSEEAVRSTLTRMSQRGLLQRHRVGRRTYFGLTPRSAAVLEEGHYRVWLTSPVNREWDGHWTVVGFSLPESWRSRRHDLRSRLLWAGFGPLQNGMWIAPSIVDVPSLLGDLGLDEHLNVLTARAAKPTEADQLMRSAFDVDSIAARYRAFLSRWDRRRPLRDLPDDLARELLLNSDWLQLIRQDPRLPTELLPADWPAVQAEEVFHDLAGAFRESAAGLAAELESIETDPVVPSITDPAEPVEP